MAEKKKNEQTKANPAEQPSAAPASELPRQPQIEELEVVRSFLKEYGNTLAYGVAAALAIIIGLSWYRNNQSSTIRQAGEKFWAARSVQDLELVAEDFPSSQYAPLAMLGAAKEYYTSGRHSQALKKYTEFQARHPRHDMLNTAVVGEFHAREALGQFGEALKGFQEFAAANPTHHMTPQALFGSARCLEAMGRTDDARAVYEQFIATHTNSAWLGKAREDLKQMNRRLARPAAASVAVPIPPPVPTTGLPETNTAGVPATIDLSNFQVK